MTTTLSLPGGQGNTAAGDAPPHHGLQPGSHMGLTLVVSPLLAHLSSPTGRASPGTGGPWASGARLLEP